MEKRKIKDIKGFISRQKRYATLAKKEGDYAAKQAVKEKGKRETEMAKDSKREAKIAYSFSTYRKQIANREAKKLS